MDELPGWELDVLRTKPLTGRPYVPRALRGRVRIAARSTSDPARAQLEGRSDLRPAATGSARARLEAAAAGVAIDPPGVAGAAGARRGRLARLAEDDGVREQAGRAAREAAEGRASTRSPRARARVYSGSSAPPARAAAEASRSRTALDRLRPPHAHRGSHDCSIGVEELLDHAEAEGLGAIAVTDHNVFGGALEAVELARGRDLVVIPGEEIKTDDPGEVIGLFLSEEIPRGMPFADTIAAIRAQGGLVYLPHPFDRLHAIPDPATLHRHLADIDVFEVYNARLLFEAYNDEALRFARKYNLTDGRRLRRARAPGRRHRRAADARVRRPGGVPDLASGAPRSCAGRSRSRTSRR